MIDLGRHSVLGTPIDAVDYDAAINRILDAAHRKAPFACTAVAVHAIMTGVHDREHLYRLQHLDLLVPDGQPVRIALRILHGARLRDRVYGPELMLRICEQCATRRLPVFLFGSTALVLDKLEKRLRAKFPALEIAGSLASRFRTLSEDEARDLAAGIYDSGAAVTFVGLGCPRQEVWAYEFAPRVSMPVVAVGQGFELNAGTRPRPPAWMQRCSLEWLFRLGHEPRRLWRRYLLLGPEFVFRVALNRNRVADAATPPVSNIRPG